MNKQATILLVALLTLPIVAASNISVDLYGNDRSFTTQAAETDLSVCSCQTLTDNITITNTGDYASTYRINTSLDTAQPGQPTIRLQPGQQARIPIYIGKSCNAQPNQQQYTVDITDTYGKTQRIERTLTTNKCQSLTAELYRTTQSQINPCQPVSYQIQTKNPAPFQETYTITTNTPEKQRIDAFTLQPGQQQTTNTTLQYQCETYGNVTPTFTVNAQNNNVQTTLKDNLTINQSYPYTFEQTRLTPDQPTCTTETLQATYEITNNAPFTNTYDIETDLNTTENITVESDESDTFTIQTTSNTPQNTSETITITSRRGDITKQQTLQTRFVNCYDTTVETNDEYYCAGQNTHPITITNNNQFTTTYTVDATTDANATFDQTQATIQPGSTQTVHLPFNNTPEGVDQGTIETTVSYQTRQDNTNTVTATASYTGLDTYQCTNLDIPDKATARYYEPLTIPITNTGIHTATYNVTTNTEAFTTSQDQITIAGQETTYYVLEHNQYENDSTTTPVEITLEKTANNYEYTNTVNVELTPAPWWETLTGYMQDTQCAQILLVLLVLLTLTILLGHKITLSAGATTTMSIAAVLILILLVLTVGLPPILQANTSLVADDNIKLTWPANQSYTINLNDYFTDPDSDTLEYNVTNTSPVSLTQDNATITVRSSRVTNTTARVTATDTQNATTTTNLILTATQPENTTLQSTYERNCHYLNWLLLVLLLTVIATRTATKTKIRRRRDHPADHKPTEDNTVDEIQAWLDKHNIDYTTKMRKQELLDLVEEHNE